MPGREGARPSRPGSEAAAEGRHLAPYAARGGPGQLGPRASGPHPGSTWAKDSQAKGGWLTRGTGGLTAPYRGWLEEVGRATRLLLEAGLRLSSGGISVAGRGWGSHCRITGATRAWQSSGRESWNRREAWVPLVRAQAAEPGPSRAVSDLGLEPREPWDGLDLLGTTWSVRHPGMRAGGRDCRELSQPVDWRLGEKAEVRLISGSPALVSLGLWKGKGVLSSLSRDRVAHRMGLWWGGRVGTSEAEVQNPLLTTPSPSARRGMPAQE